MRLNKMEQMKSRPQEELGSFGKSARELQEGQIEHCDQENCPSCQRALLDKVLGEIEDMSLGKEYTGSVDFKIGYNTAITTIIRKYKNK